MVNHSKWCYINQNDAKLFKMMTNDSNSHFIVQNYGSKWRQIVKNDCKMIPLLALYIVYVLKIFKW